MGSGEKRLTTLKGAPKNALPRRNRLHYLLGFLMCLKLPRGGIRMATTGTPTGDSPEKTKGIAEIPLSYFSIEEHPFEKEKVVMSPSPALVEQPQLKPFGFNQGTAQQPLQMMTTQLSTQQFPLLQERHLKP